MAVELELEVRDVTAVQSDYKFKLDLNSRETGFYAYNGNFECDPANLGNEETTYTPGRVPAGSAPSWTIVRCGLGTPGNDGFGVVAQPIGGGADVALGNTGETPLAWHRDDAQVNYLMQLADIEGARPAGLPASYAYDRAVAEGAVPTAVQRLSNRMGGRPFSALPPYDVKVKAYWAGSETNTRGCTIPGSIACVRIDGPYPHLEAVTMWIKYPPAPKNPLSTIWPKWTDVTTPPTSFWAQQAFFYLPQVVGHELGHGLGVFHLPSGHMMGPYQVGTVWKGPTSNDIYGFNQTRLSHDH